MMIMTIETSIIVTMIMTMIMTMSKDSNRPTTAATVRLADTSASGEFCHTSPGTRMSL